MPESRFIPFGEVFNFRDLGGYRTEGNLSVRWRRLFRADSLTRLRPADRDLFGSLGLRTVVDLRTTAEIERDGRVDGVDGADGADGYDHIEYHSVPPAYSVNDWENYHQGLDLRRFLADRYISMAENSRDTFGRALRLIADPCRSPLVMHCHVGRDRTGVLAALTLALLGVPDDQIAEDYSLSSIGVQRAFSWIQANRPLEKLPEPHLVATPPDAMSWFLAELRHRYSGIAAYAATAGVTASDVKAMRTHLLCQPRASASTAPGP